MEHHHPTSPPTDIRTAAPAVDSGERRRSWRATRIPRRNDVAVSAGAIVGVWARFLVTTVSQQQVPATFPTGTLLINLVGCLGIGILQTVFLEILSVRGTWQLFGVVGLLGGFTTFSTFSVETVQLLQAGKLALAVTYQGLSLLGGLTAVIAGIGLAHAAHRSLVGYRRRE